MDVEVNSDSIGGVFDLLHMSTSMPLPPFSTLDGRSIFELQPKNRSIFFDFRTYYIRRHLKTLHFSFEDDTNPNLNQENRLE